MDFKLPDIGEGIHEGEIVRWLVKEGDLIKEDQPMVEVMTDKATVEIPSPAKGKVQKIYFKEGQTVQVESVIVTIAEDGVPVKAPSHPQTQTVVSHAAPSMSAQPTGATPSSDSVQATPAIRKLAKDLGIDLAKVKGSGPGGRITEDDLKKSTGGMIASHPASLSHPERSEGSRFTPISIPKIAPEERLPLKGVRKAIANRLQMSKHYAPHFTYVEEIDMTDLVKLRNDKKAEAEKQGVKLTYLSYIVKALIPVLKEFPYLNASLDETTQEIVLKKYYNIGIAVSTSDGLVVPVVKNADKKSVYDVAKEIVKLSEEVRNNKAKPEDLKGSSFTVTSIGSIGGVFATPIINYPDVAILGVNKIVERPVVKDGKIVPRHMLYLSLTLDHRVVDGAVAAEFMNKLVVVLQNPKTIL